MPDDRRQLTAAAPPAPRQRRAEFNSLVAAAEVMKSRSRGTAAGGFAGRPWQDTAWEFYDAVGELRFGAGWVANGLSRLNLGAARPPLNPSDNPMMLDADDPELTTVEARAVELMAALAGGTVGQGQMMHGFGLHLVIAGEGWLLAEPDLADPLAAEFVNWSVHSSSEMRTAPGGERLNPVTGKREAVIEVADGEGRWREVHPNALIVKCWRKHPRRSWEADAPTRGVLAVLREIDLLTKHKHATATSRLAGAGLLILPTEAKFPKVRTPTPEILAETDLDDPLVDLDDEEVLEPQEDTFVDVFIDYGSTAIADRSAPAAYVPLTVRIPGEYVDKVRHISFSTPFDNATLDHLANAIQRLALGMDLPPEVLTGVGNMNHWGAWAVNETAITLHLEPLAEVVCHALTISYLRLALEAELFTPEEVASVVAWYDSTDLTSRPDLSEAAKDAYGNVAISTDAYLTEMGLSPDMRPEDDERRERLLLNAAAALPSAAPAIFLALGLIDEAQFQMMVAPPPAAAPAGPPPPESTPPETAPPGPPEEVGPPPEGINASALLYASHALVLRALERAGNRLRSQAGRNVAGGAAGIVCTDPKVLHVTLDPTVYGDLEQFLEGAWEFIDEGMAASLGVSREAWASTLHAYCRSLLAAQHAHSLDRLAHALGCEAHAAA